MMSVKAPFSPSVLGQALGVALLAVTLFAQPAHAQNESDSDLRRQNQELTTQVQDLKAELEAAQAQVKALQERITQLEAQLAAARARPSGSAPIPPLEDEQVTVDESKASGSPRALFAAVAETYRKTMVDTPIGKPGDRDRVAYIRKVEKWKPATEREYHVPVEWHVRLLQPRMTDNRRERIATFVAVDPVTDVRLGDPFDVALTAPLAKRLEELAGRGDEVFVMKGAAVLNLLVNPNRETRGSFDNPRFVGPFAEFEFTVEPNSITPMKPPAATQPAPETKPAEQPR